MREIAVVVGAGGREHALADGLRRHGAEVWVAPGNGGMAQDVKVLPADSPGAIIQQFPDQHPLVIIGPEAPLAAGWADTLREAGFRVVGPSKKAAELESQKRVAKSVMTRYRIPTAEARITFRPEELYQWIDAEADWPHVMKQSGLAQGKGVRVVYTREEALATLREWAARPHIWRDGVLWEEYLQGVEVSVQVVTNGRDYAWFPVAQDYKRLTPDPESPNTGGMGAVAPLRILDAAVVEAINERILDPVMQYLTDEHLTYRGVLYAGLMITSDGPYVLEFNVRLGDPETQVIIPIVPVNWMDFWLALSEGEVPQIPPAQGAAVGIVVAASGYPDQPKTGLSFTLGEDLDQTRIFHAASQMREGRWENTGGRVLTVVGLGNTIGEARGRAYERVRRIQFPLSYYRPDIGARWS